MICLANIVQLSSILAKKQICFLTEKQIYIQSSLLGDNMAKKPLSTTRR